MKIEPRVGGWWTSPDDDACILIDTECHGDYDHPDCAVVVVPGKNSSAREGDLLRFTELKDTSCDPIIQSGWSPIVLTAQTTLIDNEKFKIPAKVYLAHLVPALAQRGKTE